MSAAPMSLEAWQSQQRAQKQKDRQNKNQSAEMLQSYRGGIKEEDELLTKIRLEDQQKKKEAQANLASFRTNAGDIETKPSTKNNNPTKYDGPLPDNIVGAPLKDDPSTTIAAGAVSSMAANFTAHNTPETFSHTNASPANFSESAAVIPDAKAEIVQANNLTAIAPLEPQQKQQQQQQQQSPEEQEQVELDASNSQSTNSSTQEWVKVAPPPETSEPVQSTSTTCGGAAAAAGDVMERLDVDFSFGLISTRSSPNFDGYMQGVANVVTRALEDDHKNNGEMSQSLSYDPQNVPFVEKLSKDESYVDGGGRSNVSRLLVRAVVPISHNAQTMTARKARSCVIKSLAAALRSGYFIEIAENEF